MRQAEDHLYAALLGRLRMRVPSDDDIAALNTRVGAPIPLDCTPTIIARRHSVRNAMNNLKVVEASQKLSIPITYCVAKMSNRDNMTVNEALQITYPQGKVLADTILPIVPGTPLMLTRNINCYAASAVTEVSANERGKMCKECMMMAKM
jgi:hypothetical protein